MNTRICVATTLALGAALLASPAAAQTKKIAVLTFDQRQAEAGFQETFGQANVNVGRSLANLVARRIAEAGGFEIVEIQGVVPFEANPQQAAELARASGADAVVAGSILGFGTSSGTAGVSGPRVGGVRLGVGRRTTVAGVSLEARLIDVRSGTLLSMIPASATANRSGLALFVRAPGLIGNDGIIDMTRQEWQNSLLGEATNTAVATLITAVTGARDQIGTIQAPAPMAAAPAGAAPMAMPPVTGPAGPVVPYTGQPFAWVPYQFRGTEQFRYTVTRTESGSPVQNGFYALNLTPASPGNVRMQVQGQLGEDSFSNTVTIPVAEGGGMQGMGMGFSQLMAMGPIGMLLFNPTSWMFMYGRQLTVGDEWSQSSGGESFSVKVDRTCEHAGQGGALIVTRVNGVVKTESCVSPAVALPLRVLLVDDSDRTEMVLTEFRP